MKYKIITDKEFDDLKKVNGQYKENVRINSIRETFLPSGQNSLLNNGKLCIKIGNNIWHLYDLFAENEPSSNLKFSNINDKIDIDNSLNPFFESSHMLHLIKNKLYDVDGLCSYIAKPFLVGKEDKYLSLLDVDDLYNNNNQKCIIDDRGYFLSEKPIDSVARLYFSYKPNIHLKFHSPSNEIKIKFSVLYNNDTEVILYKFADVKNIYYLYNIEKMNIDYENIKYLIMELKGTSNSPDEIILEVY